MTRRYFAAGAVLATWCYCQFLLLTGSPWLNAPVFAAPDLPVGTLVAWFALISLPGALLLASPLWLKGLARYCLWASLLLALPWGFLSRALSGNWRNNYSSAAEGFIGSPQAAEAWWTYSMLTGLLPLVVLLITAVYRFVQLLRRAT